MMTMSGSKLWYAIEECFSQIARECDDAATAAKAAASIGAGPAPSRGPTGRNELPTDGPAALRGVEDDAPAPLVRVAATSHAVEIRRHNPDGANIPKLREAVRRQLETLQARLNEGLPLRDAYYVLYPLVTYADERMASVTDNRTREWQSLHDEWYDRDDGGDRFYDCFETDLEHVQTNVLVYQTFYFCLRQGFVGRLEDAVDRAKFAARIAEKFQLPAFVKPSGESQPLRIQRPKSHWYRIVGVSWSRSAIYGLALVAFVALVCLVKWLP